MAVVYFIPVCAPIAARPPRRRQPEPAGIQAQPQSDLALLVLLLGSLASALVVLLRVLWAEVTGTALLPDIRHQLDGLADAAPLSQNLLLSVAAICLGIGLNAWRLHHYGPLLPHRPRIRWSPTGARRVAVAVVVAASLAVVAVLVIGAWPDGSSVLRSEPVGLGGGNDTGTINDVVMAARALLLYIGALPLAVGLIALSAVISVRVG